MSRATIHDALLALTLTLAAALIGTGVGTLSYAQVVECGSMVR